MSAGGKNNAAVSPDRGSKKISMMAEKPMRKLIPALAVPVIIAQLISKVYNLVDTYFVSTLGTNATAAVGVNGALEELITVIATLLGAGACSYISRLLGAKDEKAADEVLSTSFFTGIGAGVLVMILGLLFTEPMVFLLGATEECAIYSMQYAYYVLFAAPFMIGNYILLSCLRSEGNSNLAMIGMSVSGILNCILDPIFIFKLDLGVAGASMATAISKVVSFCILVYPYVRKKCAVRISIRRFRYTMVAVKEVVSIGSTSFFRTLLMVFANVVTNRVAGGYSTAVLAAISVANRIMAFPFSIILGFGHGFQPAAGYSWGAKQYKRVKESLRFSSVVSLIGAAAMGVILAVFAQPIIRLFNSQADAEVLRIGALCIWLQCITLPIYSWVATINMFFAATGKALYTLLLSTARQGYCLIPAVLILPYIFGAYGVAACQAAADILNLVIAIPLGIKAFRLVNKLASLEEKCPSA